jgi:hypothetical protein
MKNIIILLLLILYSNVLSQRNIHPKDLFQIINSTIENKWDTKIDDNYFPHHVGDRWDYIVLYNGGTSYKFTQQIVKDSIGVDGSHNIFFKTSMDYPEYIIDTSLNIFQRYVTYDYLLYKLKSDSGTAWENPISGERRWAWIAQIDSGLIFSTPTKRKIYRYGPTHPDSVNFPNYIGLQEDWLASGFGLIYRLTDSEITFLNGCVIANDTFGIITSINLYDDKLPVKYDLKQNYPNPFNPNTTIEFILKRESEIYLTVYDLLGRQISVLINGRLNAGKHRVVWNAVDITSGIYFCQLKGGEFSKTIKMVLKK